MESNWRQGGYEIVNVGDNTIKIDTTDFNLIDYEKIYTTIEKSLKNSRENHAQY